MGFTDGEARNYSRNPGKLVFYTRDPSAFAQSIRDASGVILVEPVDQGPALGNAVVGFGRDLDNNLIEIVGDNTATESWFGAFGIDKLAIGNLLAGVGFATGVPSTAPGMGGRSERSDELPSIATGIHAPGLRRAAPSKAQ